MSVWKVVQLVSGLALFLVVGARFAQTWRTGRHGGRDEFGDPVLAAVLMAFGLQLIAQALGDRIGFVPRLIVLALLVAALAAYGLRAWRDS